jgi:hypothetical protein
MRYRQRLIGLRLMFMGFLTLSMVACQSSPKSSRDSTATVVPSIQPATTMPETSARASHTPSPSMVPTLIPSSTATITGTKLKPRSIAGVELNPMNESNMLAAKDLGVGWMRRNALLWSAIEPQPGVRDWSQASGLEGELKAASSQGVQVILIVRSTPPWAQKYTGVFCGPVKAEQLEDFANFMKAAVARYSVPPYNVKYWELGNEPDVDYRQVSPGSEFGCWGDQDAQDFGGAYYAQMLKVVYPQIKLADPQAHVLIGGLLLECDPDHPPLDAAGKTKDCRSARFLEGILKAGGQDYFDGVSFHSYDYFSKNLGLGAYGSGNWTSAWDTTGPVMNKKTTFLRDLLKRYQVPSKELLNTELALLCPSQNVEDCNSQDFNLTKAYYAAQAYASAQMEGLIAVIWYSNPFWRGSGLFDQQSQPLPVYSAIQVSSQAIGKANFVKELSQYTGVKGYEFQQDRSRIWILWSLDGKQHIVNLPQQPKLIYDALGEEMATSDQVSVGLKPLYLTWTQGQ